MTDFFEILGLPRSLSLDATRLERRYRELSLETHPDRVSEGTIQERRVALERQTAANDAYRALRDPLKRAEHLLALEGLPLSGEGPEGRSAIQLSPEFLGSFLELREEFSDREGEPQARSAMRDRMGVERGGRVAEIERRFLRPEGTPDRASLVELARALLELRYYDRFLEELDEDSA